MGGMEREGEEAEAEQGSERVGRAKKARTGGHLGFSDLVDATGGDAVRHRRPDGGSAAMEEASAGRQGLSGGGCAAGVSPSRTPGLS